MYPVFFKIFDDCLFVFVPKCLKRRKNGSKIKLCIYFSSASTQNVSVNSPATQLVTTMTLRCNSSLQLCLSHLYCFFSLADILKCSTYLDFQSFLAHPSKRLMFLCHEYVSDGQELQVSYLSTMII